MFSITMETETLAITKCLNLILSTLAHTVGCLVFFALVSGCMGIAENCYGMVRTWHNWDGPPVNCRQEPEDELCREQVQPAP